jgi:hypothetical protein
MAQPFYYPDFDEECHSCGASPTVVVAGHPSPHTKLCGVCFFHNPQSVDPEEWSTETDESDKDPQ